MTPFFFGWLHLYTLLMRLYNPPTVAWTSSKASRRAAAPSGDQRITGINGKPFYNVPSLYKRMLRPATITYNHVAKNEKKVEPLYRDLTFGRTIHDFYHQLVEEEENYVYKHFVVVWLQVEFKHRMNRFDIVLHIYSSESEARDASQQSDDGTFYYMPKPGLPISRWDIAKFQTLSKGRSHYATQIQKQYRARLGRKKADQARHEYYRPGGRGYQAARNSFLATAAATEAAKRLR